MSEIKTITGDTRELNLTLSESKRATPVVGFDEWKADRPQPSGVKCIGCGKLKKIVTSQNRRNQPLCSRCNNMLRRRCGKRYADVVEDPAAMLHALEEAREDRNDRKKIRKDFVAVLNILEEIEPDRHRHVWWGCRDYFADLPEAQRFLTFDEDFSSVKCQTSAHHTRPGRRVEVVEIPYEVVVTTTEGE